jgi:hypothetical protein
MGTKTEAFALGGGEGGRWRCLPCGSGGRIDSGKERERIRWSAVKARTLIIPSHYRVCVCEIIAWSFSPFFVSCKRC